MTAPSPERNLLFGLLALQNGFISRPDLREALQAWLSRRHEALAAVLLEHGSLPPRRAQVLDSLVEEHLAAHGDAARSLAALPVEPEVRGELERLAGSDLRETVAFLTLPPRPVPNGPGPGPALPAIGASRYRKVRPHARGGLGEVHVALDLELNREVALKEIQARHADRPEFRERFVREALITGELEHPGIVPVHGLGTDDQGRPCYAMRFVRGEGLDAAIDRFHRADTGRRDPGERQLALRGLLNRFLAVCHAVAYAHSRGIIHRDLKPANVMLGEYGETLVVDWGLAKAVGQADGLPAIERPISGPAGGSAPTQMGQAVGTPAFMPPEQARGDLDRVDHRSDVFALGAILYNLLTGRPPYQGEVIDQIIAATEARYPAARQVNARAPAALEAVCARAMAARPEDRYPSARHLAEDVERWLADEPVSARPDPALERARRWARRHRTLVSSAVVLLLTAVAGLALGLGAIRSEQLRTEAERDRAEGAESVATARLAQALAAEKEAKTNLQQAEDSFRMARKVVDDWFALVKDSPLLNQTVLSDDLHNFKLQLLEKALPFYKDLQAQRPGDAGLQRGGWEQLSRVAYIQATLGRPSEALRYAQQAEKAARQLLQAQPDSPTAQADLAASLSSLALLQQGLGDRAAALASLQGAARLGRALGKARPGGLTHRADLAATLNSLGLLLGDLGRWPEALACYTESADLRRALLAAEPADANRQEGLAATLNNLSLLLNDLGRKGEALKAQQEAASLRRALARARPDAPNLTADLADTLNNLAILHMALGQRDRAATTFTEAEALGRALIRTDPGAPGYRANLASTLANLSVLQRDLGLRGLALKNGQEAATLNRNLSALQPQVPGHREALAGVLNNLGLLLGETARRAQAVNLFTESASLRRALAQSHSDVPGYRADLADVLNNLGSLRRAMGQHTEALKCHEESADLGRALVTAHPAVPDYRDALASTLSNLGVLQQGLGQPARALRSYQESVRLSRGLAEGGPDVPRHRAELGGTLNNLGALHAELGQWDQALKCYNASVGLRRGLAEANPGVPGYQLALSKPLVNRAQAHRQLRQLAQAKADLAEALAALSAMKKQDAEHAELAPLVLFAHQERARVLSDLGRHRDALADWDRAIALAPPADRLAALLGRAECLARAGDHDRAADAGALVAGADAPAWALHDAARVLALCARGASQDPRRPLPRREHLAELRAHVAIALLARAARVGHFEAPANRALLSGDADLSFLRDRPDFHALVESLGGPSGRPGT